MFHDLQDGPMLVINSSLKERVVLSVLKESVALPPLPEMVISHRQHLPNLHIPFVGKILEKEVTLHLQRILGKMDMG